jgi:hypothetical protein
MTCHQVTGANKPVPGESAEQSFTHRAGRAGSVRLNLWFLPRAIFPHGGHGPQSRPGLPCTLGMFKRVLLMMISGAAAPREVLVCLEG